MSGMLLLSARSTMTYRHRQEGKARSPQGKPQGRPKAGRGSRACVSGKDARAVQFPEPGCLSTRSLNGPAPAVEIVPAPAKAYWDAVWVPAVVVR